MTTEPGLTTVQVVTLLIAGYAALVATGSLIWQLWMFRRSGPRVKASLQLGSTHGLRYRYKAMKAGWREEIREWIDDGHEPLIGIELRHVGRGAITVNTLNASFGPKHPFVIPDPLVGSLPYRLESHASAVWMVRLQDVAQHAHDLRSVGATPERFRMKVGLGTGRYVAAPETVELRELIGE